MHIRILGTRGEIEPTAPRHSKHSGVLIDGKLLFDVGEKEFLDYKPEAVFITHLHPDHAFFVRKFSPFESKTYAPEESRDTRVNILTEPLQLDSYKVTPVPTHHSKLVKSQAYLIEKDGQRLLYTGDVIWIDKEYHPLLEGLNLVITDGSYIRKGGMIRKDKETGALYGHGGIPNLVHLFAPFTKHILFVHFGSWFYKDAEAAKKKLAELGEENGVSVTPAYDGMEFDLKDLTKA
jgi:glyoxylase-like metal-dependent hydrolase (beta-lactamase superfamily II)